MTQIDTLQAELKQNNWDWQASGAKTVKELSDWRKRKALSDRAYVEYRNKFAIQANEELKYKSEYQRATLLRNANLGDLFSALKWYMPTFFMTRLRLGDVSDEELGQLVKKIFYEQLKNSNDERADDLAFNENGL